MTSIAFQKNNQHSPIIFLCLLFIPLVFHCGVNLLPKDTPNNVISAHCNENISIIPGKTSFWYSDYRGNNSIVYADMIASNSVIDIF